MKYGSGISNVPTYAGDVGDDYPYVQFIKDTLAFLNVPVSFQDYRGTATPYITFFCYNNQGEEYAENVQIATGYYIQVDIWSKKDTYDDLVNPVKIALIRAGFRGYAGQDLYESDPKIYHKAMRFNLIE